MKHQKALAALLAALLLFTLVSCGEKNTSEPVSETSSDTPDGGQQVFGLDELPDIGDFLSDEKVRYFFEDGPHAVFEPRPDYGRVIPYISRVEEYVLPGSDTCMDSGTVRIASLDQTPIESLTFCEYGLMTEDGRIITDRGWDSAFYKVFPDGTGYIELIKYRYEDGRKSDEILPVDYIGLDGSWMVSSVVYTLDRISLPDDIPYFCLFLDGDLHFYDTAGSRRFIFENRNPEKAKSRWDYQILHADPDTLTVANRFRENNGSHLRNIISTLTWDGKLLHRFEASEDVQNVGGSILFACPDKETYIPIDHDGNRLDSGSCLSVCFSETHQLYLAVTQEDGIYRANYFDTEWNPVQKESDWPQSVLGEVRDYSIIENKNTAIVHKTNARTARDFFGSPVVFPVTAEETAVFDTIRDYGTDDVCIILEKTNGRQLLCALDGTLLKEFPREKTGSATGTESTLDTLLACGDFIYVTSDRDLHCFTLATGEEHTVHLDFTDGTEKEKNSFTEQRISLRYAGKDLVTVFASLWDNETRKTLEEKSAVYSRRSRIKAATNVMLAEFYNGFCTIAAENGYCVYDPESELLMKTYDSSAV